MKVSKAIIRSAHEALGEAHPGRPALGESSGAELHLEGLNEPGALDVKRRLLEHGASPEFTSAVVRYVQASGAGGAFAIDAAASAIGQAIPVQPSPRRNKQSRIPHLFAFVGPTGAGKTTTMVKLGKRLAADGLRVLFARLDPMEEPSAQAKPAALRGQLVRLRTADDILEVLEERGPVDIIVLDTPGLSPRDAEGLRLLQHELERLSALGPIERYLVLPATRSRASLRLTQEAFQSLQPAACVLTKLDETDEPGGALSELARTRLPVAFLSDGLDLHGHLQRPRAGDFADMLLRGKRR